MATHRELFSLWYESDLKNLVIVAVVIAAEGIWGEDEATPNHANRLLWARATLENPIPAANAMFRFVLAVNKDVGLEAILNASDASIQAAVDGAVDMFAVG